MCVLQSQPPKQRLAAKQQNNNLQVYVFAVGLKIMRLLHNIDVGDSKNPGQPNPQLRKPLSRVLNVLKRFFLSGSKKEDSTGIGEILINLQTHKTLAIFLNNFKQTNNISTKNSELPCVAPAGYAHARFSVSTPISPFLVN